MISIRQLIIVSATVLIAVCFCIAQDTSYTTPYEFTALHKIAHTAIKDQAQTGTCWCFSTISFLESELLRAGKGEHDLSEMFVVRQVYPKKALHYIRMHGDARLGEGGLSHDVLDAIREFGIVPEAAYSGKNIELEYHDHREMIAVLTSTLQAVAGRPGGTLTPRWPEAIAGILNAYLGIPPAQFTYQGKTFSPLTFASSLELKLDDYIELTSYSHHPYYQKIRLELPDNWSFYEGYYNLPIDELEASVDHALEKGYSLVWDGDVSENTFLKKKYGIAIIPLDDKKFAKKERGDIELTGIIAEKEITQEMRQKSFDNLCTTDDHLMHMIGLASDQNGKKYYYIKDSGGTKSIYDGYLYLSKPYFRLKTTGIMVHRQALPGQIRQKLGLK